MQDIKMQFLWFYDLVVVVVVCVGDRRGCLKYSILSDKKLLFCLLSTLLTTTVNIALKSAIFIYYILQHKAIVKCNHTRSIISTKENSVVIDAIKIRTRNKTNMKSEC